MLAPSSLVPTPDLFRLSVKVPEKIRKELALAFLLYWVDVGAAAGRLRTSLETVLDDQRVPRMSDHHDLKGKGRLNLDQRIRKFSEAANDRESAEAMEALRVIGNIGAHG